MGKPFARELNAHQVLFDPDDSRPIYVGLNTSFIADTTSTDWEIYNFTFATTTNSNIIRIRLASGAWNARAGGIFP